MGFLQYSQKWFEHRSRSQYLLQMIGIWMEIILCCPCFKDQATQLMKWDVPSADLIELLRDVKQVTEKLEVLDRVSLLGKFLFDLGIRLFTKLLVQGFSYSGFDVGFSSSFLVLQVVPGMNLLACVLI